MIKDKILNLTSPTVHNRRSFTTIGTVLKVDEKNSCCNVRYIDNEGNYINKKNVSVRITDPKIQSWFPKEGDMVIIEMNEHSLYIDGPHYHNNNMKEKGEYRSGNNILSSASYGVSEGNLM